MTPYPILPHALPTLELALCKLKSKHLGGTYAAQVRTKLSLYLLRPFSAELKVDRLILKHPVKERGVAHVSTYDRRYR